MHINYSVLDTLDFGRVQTMAQWFTKPLRGVLGGRHITFRNGKKVLDRKIYVVWKRILLGMFLIPGSVFYTIPAAVVLFFTQNTKLDFDKQLSVKELKNSIIAKSGPKSIGGTDVQKVQVFNQWLDSEYKNKNSPTYRAYQSLARSEKINSALFIGIRGDGDCGFRAMIVSMFLELITDPTGEDKFFSLREKINASAKNYSQAVKGFDQLNDTSLQTLNLCGGSREELINLINDDRFMGDLTRVFRFLSNAICKKDFKRLGEAFRNQLIVNAEDAYFGETDSFLSAHANVNVANVQNLSPHLFAGIAQVHALAEKLCIGYWIGIVSEGQEHPQCPQIYAPESSLLTTHLLCRDNRHFDVVHRGDSL